MDSRIVTGGGNLHSPSMGTRAPESVVNADQIATSILLLRGQKVLLDVSLAILYQVETRTLIQAVKRNPKRFPADSMFRLTDQEVTRLRSQICDLKRPIGVAVWQEDDSLTIGQIQRSPLSPASATLSAWREETAPVQSMSPRG